MKKIVLILSLALLLVFSQATAFAQTTNEIIVAIDSVNVEFTEGTGFPFVDENSRTLVPFRKALEAYGATVEWDNENRVAIAVKDDIKVEVPVGEKYIIVNGEQKSNDTVAKIVGDRKYLPIRSVIEAFGATVEWDQNLKTVVITTEPIDAKGIFMEANNKSYAWKNYDADIFMKMSIPVKDDAGSVQNMEMNMEMLMTIFMEPSMKIKMNANLIMDVMGQEITQPIMDMYMGFNEKSLVSYMGMNDGTGNFTWMKTTYEDELFGDLLKQDKETIQKNKELTEKYIKDIKYFGKYNIEGNTLLRMQYTMSGDIYNDLFGESLTTMPEATNEQEQMTLDMMKVFAEGNFGDISCIVYIDEKTGEMVKYEMDLGNIVKSMVGSLAPMLGEIPEAELEILNNLEATITMNILNINKAKDFEIPEEALNAPEMTELLKELEEATEAEEVVAE